MSSAVAAGTPPALIAFRFGWLAKRRMTVFTVARHSVVITSMRLVGWHSDRDLFHLVCCGMTRGEGERERVVGGGDFLRDNNNKVLI